MGEGLDFVAQHCKSLYLSVYLALTLSYPLDGAVSSLVDLSDACIEEGIRLVQLGY